MHALTYVRSYNVYYVMSVAHFLAHIASVAKTKLQAPQHSYASHRTRYQSVAHPTRRPRPHQPHATRRPPNTTFLLYKWNFTNRPASSLIQLRLLTNITLHWLIQRSYITHKVRVHCMQQVNVQKRLLRPATYLFHFVSALLPVETAGGVIVQHRSRDKCHEYNLNAASVSECGSTLYVGGMAQDVLYMRAEYVNLHACCPRTSLYKEILIIQIIK